MRRILYLEENKYFNLDSGELFINDKVRGTLNGYPLRTLDHLASNDNHYISIEDLLYVNYGEDAYAGTTGANNIAGFICKIRHAIRDERKRYIVTDKILGYKCTVPITYVEDDAVTTIDTTHFSVTGITDVAGLDDYYSSKEYIDKAVKVCKNFYGDDLHLLSYGTQIFPDIAIVASDELKSNLSVYEDTTLSADERLEKVKALVNMPEYFKRDQTQPSTKLITAQILPEELEARVECKVREDNVGFTRQTMTLNDDGQLIGMTFGTCKYSDNVITSEVLTYETKINVHAIRQAIKDRVGPGLNSLLNAGMYSSIVGTQCIVLFYNKKENANSDRLYTKILQRSGEVYEKVGSLQFSGVGSFTVRAGENPKKFMIKDGFDIFSSLKCEYVEEFFNAKEKHAKEDSTGQKKHLEDLIKSGKAFIEFLGVSAAVDTLKTDLVYLILITDDEYANSPFDSNFEDEAKGAYTIQIDNVSTILEEDEYIYGRELVGPIELLKHSKLLQEINYIF